MVAEITVAQMGFEPLTLGHPSGGGLVYEKSGGPPWKVLGFYVELPHRPYQHLLHCQWNKEEALSNWMSLDKNVSFFGVSHERNISEVLVFITLCIARKVNKRQIFFLPFDEFSIAVIWFLGETQNSIEKCQMVPHFGVMFAIILQNLSHQVHWICV